MAEALLFYFHIACFGFNAHRDEPEGGRSRYMRQRLAG